MFRDISATVQAAVHDHDDILRQDGGKSAEVGDGKVLAD